MVFFKRLYLSLVIMLLIIPGIGLSETISTVEKPLKKPFGLTLQLGGFLMSQGTSQDINISGLVGDHFKKDSSTDSNILVGLGYYINGQQINRFNLLYGIDAFYFPKTSVHGKVVQEQLFTNLKYHYSTTNYPIYFAVKSIINNSYSERYHFTLDAGIGPNIMKTSNVSETSIDGITIPDQTFNGRTTATFSAMAGVSLRVDKIFGKMPLECGYRFFYLGQGKFNKTTDQLLDNFKTGNSYANALLCSIIF